MAERTAEQRSCGSNLEMAGTAKAQPFQMRFPVRVLRKRPFLR